MADDGLNIDFGEMYAFDMVDGDKTVGQMNVSVHKQKTSSRGESQIYPDSWFIGDTEQLKPVLEIDGFGTVGNQGGGYGRAGLQRAYEMSLEKGCDGRVEVHATWEAGDKIELSMAFEGISVIAKCKVVKVENGVAQVMFLDLPRSVATKITERYMNKGLFHQWANNI